MLIMNEHLNGYDVAFEKLETETGEFISMSFFNRAADMRFSMSAAQAEQILESLKKVLENYSGRKT